MSDLPTLASVCVSALAGTGLGLFAGLIPGLHMNNIAALFSAVSVSSLAAFGALSAVFGTQASGISVSSFLAAALVSHTVAESIPSTYVGIPSGDVVSVLPAHRLARAGLGRSAVRAAADGVLGGIVLSAVVLVPVCLLMGEPAGLYAILRRFMVVIVMLFSCVLLLSEGSRAAAQRMRSRVAKILKGALVFAASGFLGCVVLKLQFCAFPSPDLPWMPSGFVPREALLLPMFAGLFGIPSLLLSLRSGPVFDLQVTSGCVHLHRPSVRDWLLSLAGGTVVGWMPGMTSGAAATLCAPAMRETVRLSDIPSSLRFIWLYSAISASGTVFALGALFTIARARSGTMDAVQLFLDGILGDGSGPPILPVMLPLLMSMVLSALIAHYLLIAVNTRFRGVRNFMGSKAVAVASLVFVVSLSFALAGVRGAFVLVESALLGLVPPMVGVRRIQLMGCLLVPIVLTLLGAD